MRHVVWGLRVGVGGATRGNVVTPGNIELLTSNTIEVSVVLLVVNTTEAEVVTISEDHLGVGIHPGLGGQARGLVGHLLPGRVIFSLDLCHIAAAIVDILGGDAGLRHLIVVNVPEHSLSLDLTSGQPGLARATR